MKFGTTILQKVHTILLLSCQPTKYFIKSSSTQSILTTTTTTTTTLLGSSSIQKKQQQYKDLSKTALMMSSTSASDTTPTTTTTNTNTEKTQWIPNDPEQAKIARHELEVWPLDESNANLLNEVHPFRYTQSTTEPHVVYDLIAIGAGAGGLVSAKQSARRGARSAMISEKLAGGDCLNVGCVPSKALLHAAKTINIMKKGQQYFMKNKNNNDIDQNDETIDFTYIMERMRYLRTKISPADGHGATAGTGAHVFQGRGRFVGPDTIEVLPQQPKQEDGTISPVPVLLKFRKAVIATGGRPSVPNNIPGLLTAPFTTNESLFNLETLPKRMVILGAGYVALEMAYCFASFGSDVTVIQRTGQYLYESKYGDEEAGKLIQKGLEELGVHFIFEGTVQEVKTLRDVNEEDPKELPLMELVVNQKDHSRTLQCECLLIAIGRVPNIENLGLESANVQYEVGQGIVVNDYAQSTTNPNVYAVGDCVANVPRLTHVAGEMAKLIIQNSLFNDKWQLSSLVIPGVMYTDPEYATVGISSKALADHQQIPVDIYRASLEHNDRAILEENNVGYCSIVCAKDTDTILGATIIAERAGEMINEITLAMKNQIGLRAIGRNIHAYPTIGEAVMTCGVQYINSKWERLNE